MKNQKGFIVPLLTIIIVLAAIGGGAYYYFKTNPTNSLQVSNTNQTETSSTSASSSEVTSNDIGFFSQFYNRKPQPDKVVIQTNTNVQVYTKDVTKSVVATTTAASPVPTSTTTPEKVTTIEKPKINPDSSYDMGVLVLKYFPTTLDENNTERIDIGVTGDVSDTLVSIKKKTNNITNNLVTYLQKATTYLGYKNGYEPALRYHVVDTKEYKQPVPFDEDTRRPLYKQMMTDQNICNYVDNQGVREVWLFAYQGPSTQGQNNNLPYLNIWESTMAGPSGFYANGGNENIPVCDHTYRLYTFNYQRGTAEAMHSWGHQIEAEMKAIDADFFVNKFQGPYHPQTDNQIGRCGSVHNPPNSREEYDYSNSTSTKSDCLDWNPDSLGTLTQISCTLWGCDDATNPFPISDTNNAQLNYMVWNWQNLPGRNNGKTYQGKKLRNFWDIHGDFDQAIKEHTIFLN